MKRGALALLCGLIVCASSCSKPAEEAPAPVVALEQYDALKKPVTIITDELDVPHVYAQSDLDLFFAAGYLHARDRLFALDMFRRQALGRYAEVFGEAGFSTDMQSRSLGFARRGEVAAKAMAEVAPGDYNLLLAFTGGINRRLAEAKAEGLPEEFQRFNVEPEVFTPAHILAIGVRIQFGYSSMIEFEVLNSFNRKINASASSMPISASVSGAFVTRPGEAVRTSALTPLQTPAETFDDGATARVSPEEARALTEAIRRFRADLDVGDGSNAWTVNGMHTFNGRPILANDSHAGLDDPNTLFMMHLNSREAGGKFDVMGFAFLGIPGIQLGHNHRLAWGATTNFADQMDVWTVRARNDVLTIAGNEVPLTVTDEIVKVRKDDGSFEERTVKVREAGEYGVILPAELLPIPKVLLLGAGRELLVNWAGFHRPLTELTMFLDLDRATTLEEFREAVRGQRTGMQNWHGITSEGMTYITSGLVPDRGPAEGRPRVDELLNADDEETLWTGKFLTEDRLPSLDGSQPYIVSANNDPWGHTADGDPLNDAFYYGSFFTPGWRAGRLHEALGAQITAGKPITVEDMYTLQSEVFSPMAARFLTLLDGAVAALDTDAALAEWSMRQDVRDAAARLAAWDRDMTRDSKDAALYRVWLAFLTRRVLADDLGLIFNAVDDAQTILISKLALFAFESDITDLLDGDTNAHLIGALDDALALLAERGDPTWGALHEAWFNRPDRTRSTLSTGGDGSTVNVALARCWNADDSFAEKCGSSAGSVFRNIYTIGDDGTPSATFNWPRGNTASTEDWLEGRYKPWWFKKADVEAHQKSTQTLAP